MTGYQVVPQVLRNNVNYLRDSGDDFRNVADTLRSDASFERFDLGLLGEAANYVTKYNEALNHLIDRLGEAERNLQGAAAQLNNTATFYEHQEAVWYQKFGYEIQ